MDIGGIICLVIFVALIASLYYEMGKAPELPDLCRKHGIYKQWVGYHQEKALCMSCEKDARKFDRMIDDECS